MADSSPTFQKDDTVSGDGSFDVTTKAHELIESTAMADYEDSTHIITLEEEGIKSGTCSERKCPFFWVVFILYNVFFISMVAERPQMHLIM